MPARSPLTSRPCRTRPIRSSDRDAGIFFVLIGAVAAIARTLDQVQPQSGARTSPVADGHMRACSRQIESKVRLARTAAAAVAIMMIGAPIAMPFASPANAASDQIVVGPIADPFGAFVAEASLRFGVPAQWIRAVMRAESQNDLHALSPKGAMGLMQIMPSTWTLLRVRLRLGDDPYDPHDNILAGAAYLRELHDRYGSPGFLAAYNAGPGRYENHLATGRSLPAETRDYVAALAPVIDDGRGDNAVPVVSAADSWARAPLFISQDHGVPAVDQALLPAQPNYPSAARRIVDLSGFAPRADGLFVRVSDREPAR